MSSMMAILNLQMGFVTNIYTGSGNDLASVCNEAKL